MRGMGSWNSYAPISHGALGPSPGSGRGSPRWSVVSGLPLASVHSFVGLVGIWSIAGLPASSAMVSVGPPLLASPLASCGLTPSPLSAEPVLAKPHEASSEML